MADTEAAPAADPPPTETGKPKEETKPPSPKPDQDVGPPLVSVAKTDAKPGM